MRTALLLCVGLTLSCGEGSSGPKTGSATSSGTVRGISLAPADATASVLPFSAAGVTGSAAFIVIATSPALCSTLSSGKQPKSTRYLVLTPFKVNPDFSPSPPSGPGTYNVGALTIENGVALFAGTDASCQLVAAETVPASAGSITLTAIGSRYAGSFDLFFEFGDHLTGTFDAPVCSGVAAVSPGSGSLACQ